MLVLTSSNHRAHLHHIRNRLQYQWNVQLGRLEQLESHNSWHRPSHPHRPPSIHHLHSLPELGLRRRNRSSLSIVLICHTSGRAQ
jgi:hypothetical protein